MGSRCVGSSIIIKMLLKLYKVGIRCRFLTVTYVIASSYIPRKFFVMLRELLIQKNENMLYF